MIEYNGKDTKWQRQEKYADIGNIRWFSVQTETVSNPKTDSDDYDAEDLQTTGYRGSSVELEFNNDGEFPRSS